ncbi:carbon-nitrogen hydrolase family protein [Agrobacterium larrymoorei]|uniref:carbon-nitrogen hydrolase family protein n=1 Tax=Agrobacterium larrymoorei TaxID=160699 RepID=UPI0015719F2E|nr:carbon-nitrogen hydrolase family protein [Agrobacterium larrymoorei]NTJ44012.1 carbon-nitrogen hydrolase family protein [Agrobacterium larrymoorei]
MPSRSIRIAAAQISSGPDIAENLEAALTAIRQASDAGAALAILPEATSFWFGGDVRQHAQPLDGHFASTIRAKARECGIAVSVGMFEPAGDGRVYNTLLITCPDVESAYRKVHLFDAFGAKESDTVAPGNSYVTTMIAGVRIGFATCFDLRFAEQFTALGKQGAEIIAVSASWGDGPAKAEHWDLLIRARAADAQSWLVACDQAWRPPQGAAPLGIGRSAVVDPVGMVRAQLPGNSGMLVHDIDLDMVEDIRRRIPVLSHRPV